MRNQLFWLCFVLFSPGLLAQSLQEGLVLHFSADAPGTDLSGNNNYGQWTNIARVAGIPGVTDSAFHFDGSQNRIEVPASPSLNRCESFTVALWCRSDLLLSTNSSMYLMDRPVMSAASGWQECRLECLLTDFNFVLSDRVNGQKLIGCSEKRIVAQATWYHVAGAYDAKKREIYLYVNGRLSNREKVPIDARFPGRSSLFFGTRYVKGQFTSPFRGAMEDIRLYDRALDSTEVSMLTKGFHFMLPAPAYEKTEQLQAGRYIVQAMRPDGVLATHWEIVEVAAAEPFWKKSWFLLICIAATFLLTFGIAHFSNRSRQQQQILEFEKARTLERERYRIAREMHDDIGSGLSAINLLTEIALNKGKDPHLATEIERIAAASREVHSRIQDIIWAISIQDDTLASLLHYLRRYAANFLAPAGIASHVDAPDRLPAHTVPGECRRAVFLAFKEALQNIVKHARASQVDIGFQLSHQFLQIDIRDNGQGFHPAAASGLGNGLLNMKKRLEDAGGTFEIESNDQGTTVVFRVRL